MEGFKALVAKFKETKGKHTIVWDKIKPPAENIVVKEADLPAASQFRVAVQLDQLNKYIP